MANNRKAHISFWIILMISLTFVSVLITKEKVINYKCNYHFFPRADLNAIYVDSVNFDNTTDSYTTNAHTYYPIENCSIIGTAYQVQSAEFVFGFDMYEPKIQNEKMNVLYDSGKIIFNSELADKNELQTLFFDTCAFMYNDADIFDKQLIIQSDSNQEGYILGYLRTVYISPLGKMKSECIPLDSNYITVNTKDKGYFLKEICIFSAYKFETYVLQDEILYQVKNDKDIICNFTLRRTLNDK